MEIKIRKAIIEDSPAILALIKELAVFEKEPDAVEVTLKTIQNDGFGTTPLFQCFVAEVAKSTIFHMERPNISFGGFDCNRKHER